MTCSPRDLVLIPFPFSDLRREKRRPVLVLTHPDHHGDFVGLAITSVPSESNALILEDAQLAEGRLPKRSWIRLTKLYTLDQQLVVKKFGRLSDSAMERAVRALCEIAGYAPQ